MATVKIKYRASSTKPKMGRLYVQIIHNRESKQIRTTTAISESEWLNKSYLPDEVATIIERVEASIEYLEQTCKAFTVSDIDEAYTNYHKRSLFVFAQQTIDYLKSIGKQRTMETYVSTINSFKRFRTMEDVAINKIDSDLVKAYEVYLLRGGIQPNTVSFYMRILRAIYNRAVERGLSIQKYPFKGITTRPHKTVKRSLSTENLKRLKSENLTLFPSMEFARDLFMFSFYTRGMSFVDMAYLRKKDVQSGVLCYRRRKTGQQLHIRWEECMQEIVDRYSQRAEATPYLLPIIKSTTKEEDKQYKVAIHTVNHNLKRLAKLIGLTTNLTSYCARHTWASVAKSKNIPISVISEGMGHENEKTTQIYLASLDNIIIDNANFDIISDI
ncbi:MAG: site-specific integrase [Rikenellaceae bacterium]